MVHYGLSPSGTGIIGLSTGTAFQVFLNVMWICLTLCGLSTFAHLLQNREEAAGHLSRLLFVSLACGVGMFLFTWFGATPVMTGREPF